MVRAFLDLDGVLCDFVGASLKLHGIEIPMRAVRWNFTKQLPIGEADFWAPLGREFWASLPWTAEGRGILHAVESAFGVENVAILTAPCSNDGCMDGKRDWVSREIPTYKDRLIIARAKGFFGARGAVLIDDADHNISAFTKNGGVGVLVPRPWNTHAKFCDADGCCYPVQVYTSCLMAKNLSTVRTESEV